MAIESEKDFANTPEGKAQKWQKEFEASKKFFKKFRKRGEKTVRRYLDESDKSSLDIDGEEVASESLNLYHSNVTTLEAMLYGNTPKVEVARSFADSSDDVARVASLMLFRILNQDIEEAGENYAAVLRQALGDRLRPGLGCARLKYNAKIGKKTTPAIMKPNPEDPSQQIEAAPAVEEEYKEAEWVDTIYTHWQDIEWSPARTYDEIRWKRFRAWMTRDQFIARFTEKYVDKVKFNCAGPMQTEDNKDPDVKTAWDQAEIWEIWDKQTRTVQWYSDGCDCILDEKPDPLGLDGFWPDPPPLIANVTTSKYLPKADMDFAVGLYREIDSVQKRISILTAACKLVGVYETGNAGVERMLKEGVECELIPVQNWGSFSEKGGLEGAVDWLPLKDVVETITQLSVRLDQLIQQLYEITGLSDILRGSGDPRASATQENLKSKFASVRVQALQDEFARFASDLCRIKVEIISKHYDAANIIKQSNIEATLDGQNPQIIQAAVALIKNSEAAKWKIKVRPESLAMADYAQLKADRTEFLNAMAVFLQSVAPIIEQKPESTPMFLQLLKWSLAGFKGSNEVEGIVDAAIDQMMKQPPQQKPDPEQIKAQAKMQELEMKGQQMQEKHQLEMQKMSMQLQQSQQEHAMEMQKMKLEFQLEMQKLMTSMATNYRQQADQFAFNRAEAEHAHSLQMESREQEAREDRKGKSD